MANDFYKSERLCILNYIIKRNEPLMINEYTDVLFRDYNKDNPPIEVEAYRYIKNFYNIHGHIPSVELIESRFNLDDSIQYNENSTLEDNLIIIRQRAELVEGREPLTKAIEAFNNIDAESYESHVYELSQLLAKYQDTAIPSQTLSDIAPLYIAHKEAVYNGEIKKIQSGIHYLDRVLAGGFTETDYVVLVGQSGQGKSMIALRIAANIITQGYKVLYFNGEMTTNEVAQRMITFLSNGNITNSSQQGIDKDLNKNTLDKLKNMPITEAMNNFILCSGTTFGNNPTPDAIRRLAEKLHVDLVIIDQAQWINPNNKVRSEWEKLKNISRDTRNAAMASRIPFLMLHQLNRGGLSGTGSKEEYIFGSDSFRQDACTLLAYEYKKPTDDDTDIPTFKDLHGNDIPHENNNYARIQVLKSRSTDSKDKEIYLMPNYDTGEFIELKGDESSDPLSYAFNYSKDNEYLDFGEDVKF